MAFLRFLDAFLAYWPAIRAPTNNPSDSMKPAADFSVRAAADLPPNVETAKSLSESTIAGAAMAVLTGNPLTSPFCLGIDLGLDVSWLDAEPLLPVRLNPAWT